MCSGGRLAGALLVWAGSGGELFLGIDGILADGVFVREPWGLRGWYVERIYRGGLMMAGGEFGVARALHKRDEECGVRNEMLALPSAA